MAGSGEPPIRDLDGHGSEEESFRRLFDRHYRPVSYFFASRGLSVEESHDLAQETFLGVYRGMARFRNDASIETWIFAIARNVWLNEMRRRSRLKREAEETSLQEVLQEDEEALGETREAEQPPLSKHGEPLADVLAQERVALVRRALDDLPRQMRQCMLLRIQHDLKYREIAAVMGTSIETVKSQLFQAKERLKENLSTEDGDVLGADT